MPLLILGVLATTAYLAGSIPFGLVLARKFTGVDLRTTGSGNIGATNARRAGGWRLGLATLVCDVFKGAAPTGLAVIVFGRDGLAAQGAVCLVAAAAFFGHLYPVYLRLRSGGKGVATAAGCFIVLSPLSLSAALGVFIAAVALTGRVSAGSLAAAAVLPGIVYLVETPVLAGGAVILSLAVIMRHRENISRLLSGTEPGLWDRRR